MKVEILENINSSKVIHTFNKREAKKFIADPKNKVDCLQVVVDGAVMYGWDEIEFAGLI